MIQIEQEKDERKGRFVIYDNGQFAGEMTYTWAGPDKFIIDHTGIEDAFRGKGYGNKLLMRVVEFAREQGVKILPLCPFAKAAFEKNKEIADVRF